jgi:hypothetical protein
MSGQADRTAKEEGCSEVLAALDLGSNSFHLIIARVCGTEVRVLDRERLPRRPWSLSMRLLRSDPGGFHR